MAHRNSENRLNKKIAEEFAGFIGINADDLVNWLEENESSDTRLSPDQQSDLLKNVGITKQSKDHFLKPINRFVIAKGFIKYCVDQGWLLREGIGQSAHYYVTVSGTENLRKFGIEVN